MSYLIYRPQEHFSFAGRWIYPAGLEKAIACHFYAVKNFELGQVPAEALLRICADSAYRVWVNGFEVGYGPVRGTLNFSFYDLYDVRTLLRSGKNTVAVLVSSQNEDNFIADSVHAALIAEIEGCVKTDGSWLVAPAAEWRAGTEYFAAQIGRAEWRDFRNEPAHWHLGEGVSRWMAAKAVAEDSRLAQKQLFSRDVPALAERTMYPAGITAVELTARLDAPDDVHLAKRMTDEKHEPASTALQMGAASLLRPAEACAWTLPPQSESRGVSFLVDFRQEVTGFFQLEVTGAPGTVIDLAYEEVAQEGRVRSEHDTCQKIYHFAERYILDGKRRLVGTTLSERGFRIVQVVVRNFTTPVTLHAVRALDRRYPVAPRGQFFSNDMMLNQIWAVSAATLSACMLDVFIDCPWRERAFWVNDLIVENVTSLQMFGAMAIHRRAFDLAFGQRSAEGLLPGVCPAPVIHHESTPWPDNAMVLPMTNLYIGRMLLDYWRYSGDAETVKKYLPEYRSLVEIFAGWVDADGLLKVPGEFWNFVDWGYELSGQTLSNRKSAAAQAFYVMALQDLQTLHEELNLSCGGEQQAWAQRAVAAREALLTHFYEARTGRLADWLEPDGTRSTHASQLAHALAFLTGTLTPETAGPTLDALNDASLLAPEFYMHLFLLEALRRGGKVKTALNRVRTLWGRNVLTGTPTWWEAGVQAFGKEAHGQDGSLCHGFASAPVDFIQRGIVGIEPLAGGFARFLCKPDLADLEFFRAWVPTPHGNIELEARRAGAAIDLEIVVPAGTEGVLPDSRVLKAGRHRLKIEL